MPDLRYWLRRMIGRLYSHDVWYRISYDTSTAPEDPPALPRGLRLVRDRELLPAYADNERRASRIRERLADGRQMGLGLRQDDQLVYDTWIWRGEYHEPNSGLLLDPGAEGGVLLDSWTHPDSRGRGLHGMMIEQRLRLAREKGLRRVEGLVHGRNIAALRAQYRAGAELEDMISIRRCIGLRRVVKRKMSWHELSLDSE